MCYHWLWWMLPRHISLVLPLSLLMVTLPVLLFILCFMAWTWRTWLQGKLQLFLLLRFPCCGHHPPNSLRWAPAGFCWELSPVQLLLPFCGFFTLPLVVTQLLPVVWELSHTPGWHLVPALGQDWGPPATCQCLRPLGFVLVLCHLHLPEAWLMEALGD